MFDIYTSEPLICNAVQVIERERKILRFLESGEKSTEEIRKHLSSTVEKMHAVLSRLRRAGRVKKRLTTEIRVCGDRKYKTKIAYWRLA